MNDSTEPFAAPGSSGTDTTKRVPSTICRNVYLPKGLYEALPTAYLSMGALFIIGAVYIGISHRPTIGYVAVGLLCIFAGVAVNSIRYRERST